MANVYEQERELQREVSHTIESGLPGVEVIAVELSGPERFTVFVDHPAGVDHALCERITDVLRSYLREYSIDVSSPGLERPVRRRQHFRNVVGCKVALRTGQELNGRKRFRGIVIAADREALALDVSDGERVSIPYDEIARGNLIDEGNK